MELNFPHKLKYVDGETSIDEVIANLQAQKRLIETGVLFLSKIDPGLNISRLDIAVLNIEQGSLLTEILVTLYAEYQTNVEDFRP